MGAGVLDLDLDAALPAVAPPGRPLPVRCLLRRSGVPVGSVDIEVPAAGWGSVDLAAAVDPARWPARIGAAARGGADDASELTVVIATRDRPAALLAAVDSVLASTAPPARVVVVDNAPSDDAAAAAVAERYGRDDRVVYLREPVPGLACAHNAALPLVETAYVAFTDDDVVVDPAWAGWMVAGFTAADDVACVTGLIAPAELRTPEQWWIERGAGFVKGYERRIVDPAVEAGRDPLFPFAAGSFGSGANMAFATDVLRSLGGFDPALGAGSGSLGGDDLAALHAVVAAGHRLVYEPAALVFHHHHRGYEALRRQMYGYGAGLTAYLTSVVVARPSAALAMAGKAVRGARHALAPSSSRNARRPATYPELARVERAGMASGPWRYLRTHRARRGLRPSSPDGSTPRVAAAVAPTASDSTDPRSTSDRVQRLARPAVPSTRVRDLSVRAAPIPVLLYHGVAPSAPPHIQPWVMHPDRFADHLDLIVERGHTPLRVSELGDALREGRTLPDRPVAITFDDGLADFAEYAWPALRQRDLSATLYVVTGGVDGRAEWLGHGDDAPPMLSWDQVRTLDAEGCEIGSHSLSHPELDTLDAPSLLAEVELSRRELSTRLGRPVRSFAYPHGYHGRRVRDTVVRAGYDSACAVREALSSRDDDLFALARVTLLHDASVEDLAAVLDGRSGHRVAPFPEALKTKAWRTARRTRSRARALAGRPAPAGAGPVEPGS